jgi:hypothetical protein
MSYGREHLTPAVESPAPAAAIEPAVLQDFGSNELAQQLLLAQVVTTNGVKKPAPAPAPRPTGPRPTSGPIRRA